MKVSMRVNDVDHEHDVEPSTLLVQHLRENLRLLEPMLVAIQASVVHVLFTSMEKPLKLVPCLLSRQMVLK